MKKVSLISQISGVDREIAMRERVYPRQVSSGKMHDAEAELLLERMRSVRASLLFLQTHEADIREFVARKRGGQ